MFAPFAHAPAIALAVSGGPDSLAMLFLAARWRAARKSGPTLIALSVDHGLRPEAAREARAVARIARSLGVAHRTLSWRGKKPKTGLQEAARNARYALLLAAARKAGATHVLTAHTQDDQAETVLFRMARGSGLKGLAGMQSVTNVPVAAGQLPAERDATASPSRAARTLPRKRGRVGEGAKLAQKTLPERDSEASHSLKPDSIQLARPLLALPKVRLIATLKAAKIAYAEDPSNRDPRFTRVRWRALAPALAAEGLTSARLATLAARLARADAAIERAVDGAWRDVTGEGPGLAFRVAAWRALPEEIALRLLGRMVTQAGAEGPVELAKLERLHGALAAHLSAPRGRFARTLAGASVTARDGLIAVMAAPPRKARRSGADSGGSGRGKARKSA